MNYGNFQEIVNANAADIQQRTKSLQRQSDALRAVAEVAEESRTRARIRLPWFGSRTTRITE